MKKLLLPTLVGLFLLTSSIALTSSLKAMIKEDYSAENYFALLPVELKQYIALLSLESALNYNFDRSKVLLEAPDDSKLVIGRPADIIIIIGVPFDRTAWVWNIKTGQMVHILKGHTLGITSVAYSRDGITAITGSYDKTARLWDIKTGQQLHILQGHSGSIYSVAFSPDGTTALTGSRDKTACLWDVKTGQQLHILQGHASGITSLAFSPDCSTIITGSEDNITRLWTRSGEPTEIKNEKGEPSSVFQQRSRSAEELYVKKFYVVLGS